MRRIIEGIYCPNTVNTRGFNVQTFRVKEIRFSKVPVLKDGGLVVVTAGAINTPRLLLRSGITGYGTVGKTIKDHSLWHQMFRCWRDNDPKTYGEVTDQIMSQYLHDRSGALAQFGPILMGFWKDPRTSGGNDQYDVEFFLGPQEEILVVTS